MSNSCSNCGKADCAASCSACNLPGVYYCSRECQRLHWTQNHKADCKLSQQLDLEQTKLVLDYDHDNKKMKNYDAVLTFAKRYMKNINHLVIYLRQAGMWKQSEMLGFSGRYGMLEPIITITYEVLREYIETVPLVAFEFICDDCIDHQVAIITKQGKLFNALIPSRSLREFHVTNVMIKRISDLPFSTRLKSLTMSYVKFSKWNGPRKWILDDKDAIVVKISDMHSLEKLRLCAVPFLDEDLEKILLNKSNLRVLDISGTFGDRTNDDDVNVGCITDQGCKTITRLAPNLQSLSLDDQRHITLSGATEILRHCSHLRVLGLDGAQVAASDLPGLVRLSSTLLVLQVGFPFGADDPRAFGEAVKATEGRTLISESTQGLLEPEGLTECQRRQAAHTKHLLEKLENQGNDYECFNEYAFLWGIDVTVQ